MATFSTTAPWDNTTDAGYRAWIIDFHALIGGAGLLQTADTGQVNTATVTRPGTNTLNAYSIWRNSDSSMYFKIQFGSGPNGTSGPRIDVQAGEGSDGSGTLTGATTAQIVVTPNVTGVAFTNNSTNLVSYCCATTSFFGVIWKCNGNILGTTPVRPRAMATFAIFKTVNSSQTPTNDGFLFMRNTNSTGGGTTSTPTIPTIAGTNRSPAANYASGAFCIIPGATASLPADSLDLSGNNMVWMHWGNIPGPVPSLFTCTVKSGDVADLSTFSVTLFGGTAHTYIMIGEQGAGYGESMGINTNFKIAMLYE